MPDRLMDKMKSLAASYVPEWSFTQDAPDAGSVAALLFKDMLEGSLERYGKVLHKHRIRYLNLFDRFKEEPVEPAKSFVRFTPVAGAAQPVHIPKGTRLLADSAKADRQIVFETVHGITATNAALSAVYTADGAAGHIGRVFSAEEGALAENTAFTAFLSDGDNFEEHTLLLGFEHAFDYLGRLDIELLFSAANDESLQKALRFLCGEDSRFSVLCESGYELFDEVRREGNAIRLIKERFVQKKDWLSGKRCCQIAVAAPNPQALQITGVQVRFADTGLLPDEVRVGGVAQDMARFRPFGMPMELYESCEMESKTVFARVGARAELAFTLGYAAFERLLPEYELNEEYKIIMKRPAPAPKPVAAEVRADYALLEYLSDTGWKRLTREEHAAMLFNGSERGELSLGFTVPADILGEELAAGQPRMRFRLLRAEGLYQIPCIQHCPVIRGLRFSYDYADSPALPDVALTRNNFEHTDVTGLLREGRGVTPFYSREDERPAIYLGFEGSPWGTPFSLYLRLENHADYAVDFTAECFVPGGFVPLKVADGTMGLLHSGALCMIVPPDAAPCALYGRELYWLRLICHNKSIKSYHLPVIHGIYTNMAKVENAHTRTEVFYRDAADGPFQISLEEQGILAAQVYLNEDDGGEGENWVLWEAFRHREQQGRLYGIDPAAGTIQIGQNALAAFPLKSDGPAAKVVYQSYRGSAANVGQGAINSLMTSIRHISGVSNPMPAYGGYDGYNEETGAAVISNMLRTRNRAVTGQDYFDIISRVSYGIRQVKCLCGRGPGGETREGTVTVGVLIDEYEKGSHIFLGIKEAIRKKLLACSGLIPEGKTLVLTQPRFVRMSARLWLDCERMESAFDMQRECGESIRSFIDPLSGGFDGGGWEIGKLPTPTQLVAYLKIRHPEVIVSQIAVTAFYENREVAVDDRISRQIDNPFAMAVNGEHTVYCRLMEV